jgi:hypothetical protein
MIKNKNVWLLSLLVSLAFGVSVCAQGYGDQDRDRDRDRDRYRGRWAHLGEAHVDGQNDHDNIRVGMRDGRFRAIQLRVSGGTIDFQRVVVHFGNGSQEELVFRERIPSGGRTRPLDLPGERRVIESVEMWYSKENWRRKPRVDLYGIR